jgi:sulfite exporter TauE/SafE/copper chaperone CopZ/plastocyanin domain-containing protein
MKSKLIRETLHIGGMTCMSCQNKIEKKLRSTSGIESVEVSYNQGTAAVAFDAGLVTLKEIEAFIGALGYEVRTIKKPGANGKRFAAILIIVLAVYMLLRQFGLMDIFNMFPTAEAGMGYGMLFVIGLLTSVHCVAMCGGINLSQCIPQTAMGGSARKTAALRPSFLYNLGRVISYTAIGAVVGALGSVISFTGAMRGIVQLLAGVFMVIMGVNMLGLFPGLRKFTPRIPRVFSRRVNAEKGKSNSPFYVGLFNGLMPCGPLQAMQIYALSTGSPVKGALSMLLFSLGTVPLMFALGALSSVLTKRFTHKVMTAGAALVVILGITMFSQGWTLSGLPGLPLNLTVGLQANASAAPVQATEEGFQIINSTLASNRYPAITVVAGTPVRWTIDAPEGSINGCNDTMIIPEYNVEHAFRTGANVIEFTPDKAGVFPYSCWMGMIRSTITVVEGGEVSGKLSSGAAVQATPLPASLDTNVSSEPVPANVAIPTDALAVAVIDGEVQRIAIELTDSGFSPAIVVAQAGVQAEWTINNTSSREGNSILLVPAYKTQIILDPGANPLFIIPGEDFDFSTGDNAFYGYFKVVDDVGTPDTDKIKNEAANFQTQVWPPETFE